jgi:carboxylesterase type B
MFVRAPKDLNETTYTAAIAQILGPDLAADVAAQYPCSAYKADLGQGACWWALAAVERDCMFTCPVSTSSFHLANLPGRTNSAHSYAYWYTQVLLVVDIVDLFKPYRCFHGSELPSVFDLWPALIGEGEAAMAQWFVRAWTAFAATGDPNYAGAPGAWSPFGAGNSTLVISTGAGGVSLNNTASIFADPCAFWAAHPVPESVIWGR